MSDPTPDDIRRALDVLGIDPEWVRTDTPNSQDRCLVRLETAVRALRALDAPSVPVTKDTPAGREIERTDKSLNHPSHDKYTVIGHYPTEAFALAAWSNGELAMISTYGYDAGWVEVRRPEPEPANGAEEIHSSDESSPPANPHSPSEGSPVRVISEPEDER